MSFRVEREISGISKQPNQEIRRFARNDYICLSC